MDDINESLCWYDPRHPDFDPDYWKEWGEDAPTPRKEDCSCDNCFYGRDELAMEIIRLTPKAIQGSAFVEMGEYIGNEYEFEGVFDLFEINGVAWVLLVPVSELKTRGLICEPEAPQN